MIIMTKVIPIKGITAVFVKCADNIEKVLMNIQKSFHEINVNIATWCNTNIKDGIIK